MLPIDHSTISYGSSDGGETIHNSSPKLASLMLQAAKKLNLAPHLVGKPPFTTTLAAPVDIEGHCGRDGRFYLIDFARVFPSEYFTNSTAKPGQFLYKLLRPVLSSHFLFFIHLFFIHLTFLFKLRSW